MQGTGEGGASFKSKKNNFYMGHSRERTQKFLKSLSFWKRVRYEIKTTIFHRVPSVRKYGIRWLYDRVYRSRIRNRRWRKRRPNSYYNPNQAKRAVAMRDGWKCNNPLCPSHTQADIRKIPKLTLDHVIPVSKGGTDVLSNWQLLCRPCHDVKDGMVPKD